MKSHSKAGESYARSGVRSHRLVVRPVKTRTGDQREENAAAAGNADAIDGGTQNDGWNCEGAARETRVTATEFDGMGMDARDMMSLGCWRCRYA